MTNQDKAKAAVELIPEIEFLVKQNEGSELLPKILSVLELLRPLAAGTHVLIEANLPRQIYNEAFQQGMREHTHFNGGKSWNDSKFPPMLTASQEQECMK
jgi:hypothetical protein